jgi:hypothetical protein
VARSLINEGGDAPGCHAAASVPPRALPGALPRNLLLSRKIFSRIAKFISVQKKVSKIMAFAGASETSAITVRAVAFSTRGHGTDGSVGGLIAPRVPRIP